MFSFEGTPTGTNYFQGLKKDTRAGVAQNSRARGRFSRLFHLPGLHFDPVSIFEPHWGDGPRVMVPKGTLVSQHAGWLPKGKLFGQFGGPPKTDTHCKLLALTQSTDIFPSSFWLDLLTWFAFAMGYTHQRLFSSKLRPVPALRGGF